MTDAIAKMKSQLSRAESRRGYPTTVVMHKPASEGTPAVAASSRPVRSNRPAKRSHLLHTTLSAEAFNLLEELTRRQRRIHGRGWQRNATIEAALAVYARTLDASLTG